MLGHIKPGLRSVSARTISTAVVPEVEVVDRPLLVAHVYVERKEVERGNRLATQHLEQVGESVAVELRRQRRVRHDGS